MWLPFAVAVGHSARAEEFESGGLVREDEEPLTSVRRSNIRRPTKTPFRIEPERGKVRDHGVEAQSKVTCDVLKENERRFALRDDACDVRPEVAFVFDAKLFAGDGEGLAGIARSDEIHCTAPAFAVEGCEIVPDRSRIQPRLFHPGHEHGRGKGFPLDEANSATPSGQPEVDAADSGAERDGT